jgi:hypothetical protein
VVALNERLWRESDVSGMTPNFRIIHAHL